MNGLSSLWKDRAGSFARMDEQGIVLLLGGNLDDPERVLDRAEEELVLRVGKVVARSRDHWTEPWGFQAETLFLNRALLVRSRSEPYEVLRHCLAVEKDLGRVRSSGPAPTSRLIDIDLLLVGQEMIHTADLSLPHPRLHMRWFALSPLADIWPHWRHPEMGASALELLNALAEHP